jgi:Protein of unknown function (DUF2591)
MESEPVMKIRISKATKPQIDWLVAKCEGETPRTVVNHTVTEFIAGIRRYYVTIDHWAHETDTRYDPSTNWAQGGPIIEREGVNISIQNDDHGNTYSGEARWWAQMDCRVHTSYGPTPLIAAMRCFVASKLGNEVEVPDALA